MKKILLLFLSFLLLGNFLTSYAWDNDNDAIEDSIDVCLNTSLWEIVDESWSAIWCSETQKEADIDGDGLPDYLDNDNDNDGLTDIEELTERIIQIPLFISIEEETEDNYIFIPVISNTLNSDSDGDNLSDLEERDKWTHPLDRDTDKDGVSDEFDQEITSVEWSKYVNSSGEYSLSIYNNADDDNDGIINFEDQCPGSSEDSEVYLSGENIWCSTYQKGVALVDSDFDGVLDPDDLCPWTSYSYINYVDSTGCKINKSIADSILSRQYNYERVNVINYSIYNTANNISIGGSAWTESSNVGNNDKFQDFNDRSQFIEVTTWGEKWLYNTLILVARDLKNLFYIIATIYFLVISLKLILSNNTEEELWNFKKWIIWITIGIIVMQIAFAFTTIMYDQWVSAQLWASLIEHLVWPIITLIYTLASIFFIAMAIYAFYRLVTANGNEEAVKSGKMTIVYALLGFMILRFSRAIVEAFYGSISCESFDYGFIIVDGENCINRLDISEGANIILTVLNWVNWFIAILVLIMIMYAGFQILLSGGDEERVKKWKTAILYIALGLFLLVVNYLILTFFFVPAGTI